MGVRSRDSSEEEPLSAASTAIGWSKISAEVRGSEDESTRGTSGSPAKEGGGWNINRVRCRGHSTGVEILPGRFKQVVKLVFSAEAWIHNPAAVVLGHGGQGREEDTKGSEEGSLQDSRVNEVSQISEGFIARIGCFRVGGNKSVRENGAINDRAGELQHSSNMAKDISFLLWGQAPRIDYSC